MRMTLDLVVRVVMTRMNMLLDLTEVRERDGRISPVYAERLVSPFMLQLSMDISMLPSIFLLKSTTGEADDSVVKVAWAKRCKSFRRNDAACCGERVLQWLYEEYHADPRINLFWVYKDDEDEYVSVVDVAAANGHLEIVKYLLQVGNEDVDSIEQQRKRRRTEMFSNLPIGSRLRLRRFLHTEQLISSCTNKAMDDAAAAGHLNVVQWLDVNRTEGCTPDAMDFAAQNGYLETVQWLHSNRSEGCTTEAMDGAAGGGHLDVVKWLHEHRVEG